MKYMWTQKNDTNLIIVPQNTGKKLFTNEFTEAMDHRLEHMASKKGKRFRSAFTTEQVNYLEKEFRKFPYIGNNHRKEVANALNIPERAVKIWFQNRRMKEKKDAVIKDTEFDDRSNHKNVEFTNDQLNDVRAMPSVNVQSLNGLSLPTKCEDTSNKTNNIDTNVTCAVHIPGPPKTNFYKELLPSHDHIPLTDVNYSRSPPVVINNTVPTPIDTSSAEFSIDLCKKYKNDFINNNNNNEQLQKPKSENVIAQPLELKKQETTREIKYTPESVPQDLSCNKANYRPQSESPPKNTSPNNLGYQPVYVANYAQQCMPGNMLWKPVNVMPIVPAGVSAVSISSNLAGSLSVAQNQSAPKKPCTCDCHVKSPASVNFAENNQNPQAQYIITAVPVQNYSKF